MFRPALAAFLFLILLCQAALPATLKEMYDQAPALHGYDRYIELETGVVYTGGLYIGQTFNRITAEFQGRGENVRIVGNGAILDLEGGEICISYCSHELSIDDCVILNGDIRYRGIEAGIYEYPTGFVRHVTFYRPHDYGVRIFAAGADISLEWNIIVDCQDTGGDFMYLNGNKNDWLPTGASIVFSGIIGTFGVPVVKDNWSYHTDPDVNADPLRHFTLLCEYG
ncbi:MAG: hypothetical protein ACYTG7_05875 [Planctomycetota bacterium]|jgi:hypothetical protein